MVWQLFATCHSVKKSGESFLGDEVDLRMFLFSEYEFQDVDDAESCFSVLNKNKG